MVSVGIQSPLDVFAADSSFRVGLDVASIDSGPPTVPVNLAAVAQTQTQVSVTWDPSTDDLGVVGYVLYRDGFAYATTTNTSYIDTGLTASTTYMYEVNAFDQIGNYSATSTSVLVTTLSVPPPQPSGSGTSTRSRSGGGASFAPPGYAGVYPESPESPFLITNVVYTPGENSILISWRTTYISDSKVLWGRTSDFETGSIYRQQMDLEHSVVIDQLEPGTGYQIHIESMTPQGVITAYESTFYTLLPRQELMQNVTNITFQETGTGVEIKWNNGMLSTSTDVRAVSSERFFPQDPYDGKVLYEGTGNSFNDPQGLSNETTYYSLFTKGEDGTYSSGAVGTYSRGDGINFFSTSTLAGLEQLDVNLIQVLQKNKNIISDGEGVFEIHETSVVEVRLPSSIHHGDYKAILVSVINSEEEKGIDTFLFSYDRQKEKYIAYIPQDSLVEGEQDVLISYYGFDNKVKAYTRAIFDKKSDGSNMRYSVRGIEQYLSKFVNNFSLVFLLVFLLIIYMVSRRISGGVKP